MTVQGLNVMLVEDHAVLRGILQEYVTNMSQVASCRTTANAEDALEDVAQSEPDLMLIDLSLPGMSGIDLVRKLRKSNPALRCAILSGHRSLSYARQAMEAGARGYLLKGDPSEIERGVAAIVDGRKFVSKGLGEGL